MKRRLELAAEQIAGGQALEAGRHRQLDGLLDDERRDGGGGDERGHLDGFREAESSQAGEVALLRLGVVRRLDLGRVLRHGDGADVGRLEPVERGEMGAARKSADGSIGLLRERRLDAGVGVLDGATAALAAGARRVAGRAGGEEAERQAGGRDRGLGHDRRRGGDCLQ